MVKAGSQPQYDILLTNPPYSADHIRSILQFCVSSDKPWLLLIPNYVYVQDYYKPTLGSSSNPFFVLPARRYSYCAPAGARSDREQKTSPFISFWFCDLRESNSAFLRWWASWPQNNRGPVVQAVGSVTKLPHRFRAQYDPSRRRVRKKQREVARRRYLGVSGGKAQHGKRNRPAVR